MKSPPYHPESNGWAEVAVRIVKQSLKKMLLEKHNKNSLDLKLQQFLFKYCNTIVTSTNETPSYRMFCYRPKTLLEVLKPGTKNSRQTPEIKCKNTERKRKENCMHESVKINNNKTKQFKLNELVLYRNQFKDDVKWIKAKINKILS